MILKNKKTLLITSLLILLPIPVGLALRSRFPAGLMDAAFTTIYMPPLCLLVGHWVCALFTSLDSGNRNRNRKVQTLVLWIMPVISWFCSGLMYALYLGLEFSEVSWTLALMGILFTAIGNYLPKTKMNHTIGIKISWAYTSEENWAATHRFAGKVWVIGGILLLLGIFLPEGAAIALMFIDIIVLCALPMGYSWRFWRKQKAEGAEIKDLRQTNPRLTKAAVILLVLLSVFCLSILFSGDLKYTFSEDSFTIAADWYSDLTLRYDSIESLEYREGNVPGTRVGGFGSLRLLMGYFKNEEFGTYTRYTYYNPESCVVLTVRGKAVVLSGKTAADTQALYQSLLSRIR